jgi:serine/threonine protein kinase
MDTDRAIPGMLNHSSVKEIMTLRKLNHENIASAQNVHYSHNLNNLSHFDPNKKSFKMFIEMDRARHDLFELTNSKDKRVLLKPSEIKCIMKQIVSGVHYLHKVQNIVHRDLKAPNILWFDDGTIKITDFNHAIEVCKLAETKYKGNCGTSWFKAPELLFDMPYDYSIDIWALGCIFEYLLTGDFIFKFEMPEKKQTETMIRKLNLLPIIEKLGCPTNKTWPGVESQNLYQFLDPSKQESKLRQYLKDKRVYDTEAIDLLEKMLVLNPA